ncbi:MAG: hypothetical protein HGA87_02485 [Desulfobulbaceae bacterium]|nr:hypothetical protein [Desulfobulbaceae bacterium]
MSEAKFTPGPWRYQCETNDHHPSIYAENNWKFISVWKSNSVAPKEADGLLMAAAPEMYTALERCLRREYNPFEPDNQSALYVRIDAVLKKARGEV